MVKLTNCNGDVIPSIGLGTFPLQGRELAEIVKTAFRIGYRLIDTSDDYRGESGIGLAVNELLESKECKREDLFLQTKISADASYNDEPLQGLYFSKNSYFMKRHSVEDVVREKVYTSLNKMHTDYLDSLLIHFPYSGYIEEIWETMIKLKDEGLVRYIGVSNFRNYHIERISKIGEKPKINEIYVSPIGSKQEQIDYCKRNDIQTMVYSPLKDVFDKRIADNIFKPLTQKYQKSLSQIILRWNIERCCIPLPKTKTPSRLKENFDIFNFSLTLDEIEKINSLNYDFQYLPESKMCPGI